MNKNPKILIAALTIVTSIFSILPANTNTAYAAVTGEKKMNFQKFLMITRIMSSTTIIWTMTQIR